MAVGALGTLGMLSGCSGQSEGTTTEHRLERLSAAERRTRCEIIRDTAAARGLTNGLLLGGIADAETGLAHCWSEATWACQGPTHPDCGGPVIAGAGDGPCSLQQGGLGMFQFDAGTFDDTLAREGDRVLSLQGNVDAGVDFVVDMVIRSTYVPGVENETQALAWMNEVRVDGPTHDAWIKTVTHYYNGCVPGGCSVYDQRYSHYDGNFRGLLGELGDDFWYPPVASGAGGSPTGVGGLPNSGAGGGGNTSAGGVPGTGGSFDVGGAPTAGASSWPTETGGASAVATGGTPPSAGSGSQALGPTSRREGGGGGCRVGSTTAPSVSWLSLVLLGFALRRRL